MNEKTILARIYPSVVTYLGDWRTMMRDVNHLKLKEISIFLTAATYKKRRDIYTALRKTSVRHIAHAHIREDFQEEELDFLARNYGTKVFTLHYSHINKFQNSKYRKKIFIENNKGRDEIKKKDQMKKMGGLCIDLSHFEEYRVHEKRMFKLTQKLVSEYKIGCNHLSAVLSNGRSHHRAKGMAQLEYITKIPIKYFSRYINLELANPIREQLIFRKKLASLLAKAWQKNNNHRQ